MGGLHYRRKNWGKIGEENIGLLRIINLVLVIGFQKMVQTFIQIVTIQEGAQTDRQTDRQTDKVLIFSYHEL